MRRSILALALTFATPAAALAAQWEFDGAHTIPRFTVKHMMVTNVHGEFGAVTGTVNIDDKDPTKSSVTAEIDATTIDTRNPKRDEHLKSADFFDVQKHPKLTFRSTKVEKGSAANIYKVTGDLTIRGVTKPTTFEIELSGKEVKDPWGMTKTGGVATATINRKDFGLNWNKALEAGGVLVGDDVKIQLDFELTKKDAAKKS